MLLSFRFANHRSFRDEQQLNLTPVYDGEGDGDEGSPKAVPVVGIFGANASGKSNVISAFRYLQTMVGSSDRDSEPGVGPRREPFRLDLEAGREPSSYAIDLLLAGVRHTYGFTVDDERITGEWLYSYPYRRKRVIFDRAGQSFEWGDEAKKSRVRQLEALVAPSVLFISVAARFEPHDPETGQADDTASSLRALYHWLQREVTQVKPSGHDSFLSGRDYALLLGSGDRRLAIVELLRAADVGLEEVLVNDQQLARWEIADSMVEAPEEQPLIIEGPPGIGKTQIYRNVLRALVNTSVGGPGVTFRHRGAADSIAMDVEDESAGTLRLLELACKAIPVLEEGGLLLVDEIDSSLHPLLTAAVIRLFQSPTANPLGAQVMFTTHDATLLGSIDGEDVLRRDEVWFASKGDDGASELFPLAEFKPRRQGENREKRYLNGSYGAIPELSMELFERAVSTRADDRAQ
jgi:uncharacterized protein